MRLFLLSVLPVTLACGGPTVGDINEQEVTLTFAPITRQPDETGGAPAESEPATSAGQGGESTRGGESGQGGPSGSSGFAPTRAFLNASSVTLVPCRAGARDVVLDPRGYELFEYPSERVLTAVSELCSVRLDIAPPSDDAASLEVDGKSGSGDELKLTSDRSLSLSFDAADEDGYGTVDLLLGIDLATWLAGLPLPKSADAQTQKLADQLAGASALYADRNGNGRLDDDETEPLAHAKVAR